MSDKPAKIRGFQRGSWFFVVFCGGDLLVIGNLGFNKCEESRGRKGRKFVFDAVEFGGIEGVDVAKEYLMR